MTICTWIFPLWLCPSGWVQIRAWCPGKCALQNCSPSSCARSVVKPLSVPSRGSKLMIYTGLLHQYSDCGGVFCPLFTTTTVKRGRFGKRSENFFIFPVCSLQQSGGVVCQRFLKMGAKKAVNLFKIYCLSSAVMGGGIKLSAVFQMEFICNRFLSAFQFLFCNLP